MNRFGWIPDLPDQRDYRYVPPAPTPTRLKVVVDLRSKFPAAYDQGSLGSCTANAVCGSSQFLRPTFDPARLFLYYNTRLMEGTELWDAGATIRDTIKSLAATGVCPEPKWPYVIADFAKRPTDRAYEEALAHQALVYRRIPIDHIAMQSVLTEGYPFVFGFVVYESFTRPWPTPGVMPMPKPNERVLGGHAVLCVGYNVHRRVFYVRNSWGANWENHGCFDMPFDFMSNDYTDDFWVLTAEE